MTTRRSTRATRAWVWTPGGRRVLPPAMEQDGAPAVAEGWAPGRTGAISWRAAPFLTMTALKPSRYGVRCHARAGAAAARLGSTPAGWGAVFGQAARAPAAVLRLAPDVPVRVTVRGNRAEP